MRGSDFLGTAIRLRDAPDAAKREADLRTAAGRSYYALFQSILEVLAAFGVSLTQTGADHEVALDALVRIRDGSTGSTRARLEGVRADLSTLKQWRSQADYVIPTKLAQWTFALGAIHNVTRTAKRSIDALDEERPNLDATLVRRAGDDAVRKAQQKKFDRRT
jgi:hypothetical protein